jgi:hypothetical protein
MMVFLLLRQKKQVTVMSHGYDSFPNCMLLWLSLEVESGDLLNFGRLGLVVDGQTTT